MVGTGQSLSALVGWSVDDLVGAGFEIGWIGIRRGWEIGVNADANRHAWSEIVDVDIGDEQGGSAADQIMAVALVDKPEGNGPIRLSDFERNGLELALGRRGAGGASWLSRTRGCPGPHRGPHNDAQDAIDGRIEAGLDCAGGPNVEDGVKGLDGGAL